MVIKIILMSIRHITTMPKAGNEMNSRTNMKMYVTGVIHI